MGTATKVLKYIVGGAIVLALGSLAGWYFYINYQSRSINATDAARGYGSAVPLFGSPAGSTQGDVADTLGNSGAANFSGLNSSSPLWEVDKTPVAGMGFVTITMSGTGVTASSTLLYYAERVNGNIFSADPSNGSVVRLANTLMAKTYEAFFAPNGGVIERSIDQGGNVTTFEGMVSTTTPAADATSTPGTLVGFYLEPNIENISVNPVSGGLAYTVADAQGMTDMLTRSWGGAKETKVFSSPVGSWRISWLGDNRIVIAENAADNTVGYAYTIGKSAALTALATGLPGLSVLPDPGTGALIYSTSNNGTLSLYIQTAPSASPTLLSIRTIADKCVWVPGKSLIAYCAVPLSAPTGNFVDGWYQGAVHTQDAWWRIDVSAGTATLAYDPSTAGISLDVENPTMDASGNYIAFMNGSDKSLWILHVTE